MSRKLRTPKYYYSIYYFDESNAFTISISISMFEFNDLFCLSSISTCSKLWLIFYDCKLINHWKSPVSRFTVREYDKRDTLLRSINGNGRKSRYTERTKFLDLQCRYKTFSLRRTDDHQFKTRSSSIRSETKKSEVNKYSRGEIRKEEEFEKTGQGEANR